jgi:hypothetical protein
MPAVPLVAVEIPAQVAPEYAAEALRSCTLALGRGKCAWAASNPAPHGESYLAYIGMDPARPESLRIELRDVSSHEKTATYTRELTFEPADAATHRWSTAGVVVAALVVSAGSGRGSETAAGASESAVDGAIVTPPPSTPKSKAWTDGRGAQRSQPAQASERALCFDLGVVAGPGVENHGPRYGMTLRPSLAVTPNLILWAGIRGSHAADPVSVFWWSGAAGLGFVTAIVPRWLAIETRFGPFLDRVSFKATNASGTSDSDSRWRYGVSAGVGVVLNAHGALGVFAGLDGAIGQPRVKIQTGSKEVGQLAATEVFVAAGLRGRFHLGR